MNEIVVSKGRWWRCPIVVSLAGGGLGQGEKSVNIKGMNDYE